MKIYENITSLIGNTPLLSANAFAKKCDLNAKILAKLEYFNPAGSVKDRVALSMIQAAEKANLLDCDTVIIEPTSGNTGIGLAFISLARDYKLILTMPETMSVERRNLLKAYGAEIVLTPGNLGMNGAIAKANELASQYEKSFIPSQFANTANPQAHIESTGPEIWADTDGTVDIFIGGVGTGGTVSGVGAYLKSQNPNIKIIAVEPANSPFISEGKAGPHKIQGIGAGFLPEILNKEVIDQVITITDEAAKQTARDFLKAQGVLVGISSGAALAAAREVASLAENKGKTIVVLLPDTGERYLSTGLFTD